MGDNYLRVNVPLRDLPPGMSSEASDARPQNIKGMQEIGMELAENMDLELDRFVDLLINSQDIG